MTSHHLGAMALAFPMSRLFQFQTPGASLRLALITLTTRFRTKPSQISLPILLSGFSIMSWSCPNCTFTNPQTQKSNCEICLSPRPAPSSSSSSAVAVSSSVLPKWSCSACTFLNSYATPNCEICGTRASLSSLSSFDDLNTSDQDCDSLGSVFFPLRRCHSRLPDSGCELAVNHKRKVGDRDEDVSAEFGGFPGTKSFNQACSSSENVEASDNKVTPKAALEDRTSSGIITILTYNVWFREDLEMVERMRAIGNLILLHSPDVICLQEVTPDIYGTFQKSGWWQKYQCSVSPQLAQARSYFCMLLAKVPVKSFSRKPFNNTMMSRELCISEVDLKAVDDKSTLSLVVATSHLESPCPGPPKWDQMYSKERVEQAKESVNHLQNHPNVVFCGDMNWDDKLDGSFPLKKGWVDAWAQLRPNETGFTYDTKSNKMLTGNRTLQKRLDRCFCSLQDFKLSGIEMIGMKEIPCLSYTKEKKTKAGIKKLVLPVLPSDHFGLLMTITRHV